MLSGKIFPEELAEKDKISKQKMKSIIWLCSLSSSEGGRNFGGKKK